MQFVQSQVQAMNRDTVFNARRLFVGGVPIGTSDVSGPAWPAGRHSRSSSSMRIESKDPVQQ